MWLLDANMDVHLVQTLNELGVSCDTAANRGWKALSNGELVSAAVAAGFTCLLTRDQLFGESAARALKTFPSFAVVVVDLPSNAGRHIKNSSLRHGVQDPSNRLPVSWFTGPRSDRLFSRNQLSAGASAHVRQRDHASIIGPRWHRSKSRAK